MQWIQRRNLDGAYRRVLRFKCNRCGTTEEVAYPDGDSPPAPPHEWREGEASGWHYCPRCEKPAQRSPLPVLN